MNDFLSSGQLTRRLGVSHRVLDGLLAVNPALEPRLRVGNRRAFAADEVVAVERALESRRTKGKVNLAAGT